jgi:PTS system nitrogen regulatory IIA component
MDVQSLVWKQAIEFFSARNKQDALAYMIRKAVKHPSVHDPQALEDGILSRERVISTGIGLGVAIPHAKLPSVRDFFVCVGVLAQGVDWDSTDEEPVRIILLIVGPDNQQNPYLQILAKLSSIIKLPANRETILAATTGDQILQLFSTT